LLGKAKGNENITIHLQEMEWEGVLLGIGTSGGQVCGNTIMEFLLLYRAF
jgi:hypothetical protein